MVGGLYFVGVPFLRKRKSPLLFGVGEDASVVASTIAGNPRTEPDRHTRHHTLSFDPAVIGPGNAGITHGRTKR